jgi:hypothetical protein
VAATQAAPAADQKAGSERRLRGAYPTPPDLVQRVVAAVLPPIEAGRRVSVLDPACGDGRFLAAAADVLLAAGAIPVLHGVDVDPAAAADARRHLDGRGDVRIEVADALHHEWGAARYDAVLTNPPFLSQLAAATTRRRASRRGGGPYADVAAEFLDLAVALARPDGGRVGIVLPQSILGSRDAGAIRARVDRLAERTWSWWSPRLHFDADVVVCALGLCRREVAAGASGNHPQPGSDRESVWTDVVTRALGIPDLPALDVAGTVADRAALTANFRDEYYGLVGAVGDHDRGPRFVTSGLIDPGQCRWGERPVTFGRRRFERPRVDVERLDPRMRRWAASLGVPKVLIANQTRVLECVLDGDGSMLPGVPVITARPAVGGARHLAAVAAVLSAPLASAWLWHAAAGTGLSGRTVRLRPALVAAVPWPAGSLDAAVEAYAAGDRAAAALAVHDAYGIAGADGGQRLVRWWRDWSPQERRAA